MKAKLIIVIPVLVLFSIALNAQSSFKLGKKEILLPSRCIMKKSTGYAEKKNFIEFKSDTIYYYEIEMDLDGHAFDEATMYTIPLKAFELDYFRLEKRITENFDGSIEEEYNIWMNIFVTSKTKTAWRYTYNKKGKLIKKKQSYLSMYCDDRQIYDEIKEMVKAK